MSNVIDQRVVEMQFDNRQFEQNVSTTMSTLDKLKQSLNLTGAAKGLENVGAAAKGIDLSGLSSAAETVTVKFSYMQMAIQHQLNKIVDSAFTAGKKIVSALTIDPVKTGFQEYETQINATQTILANTKSKGSTIDDVNRALEELNKYADLTIYNFTEMTRNIGTFTAAGIDLNTSVNAIQGIANLAAVSGSTSQQASTAMYQLSQALSSGTVRLMDWNSVVNAGMGGQMFQDALKKTSELLGTGAEAAIKAKGSFRESLQTGWLTAEVLTETLKTFTTSGANEYVAEYTGLSKEAVEAALKEAEARHGEAKAIDEASKALAKKSGKNADEIKSALEFAKSAEDAATKVKTFTQLWDVMKEAAQSGWSKTWKLIVGDFEQAKGLLTPLADFFTGIINKMSDARNELLESALGMGFTKLTDGLSKALGPIEKTTEAVKDLGDIVDKVIGGDFGSGNERFDALTKAGYNYYEVQNKVNEQLGLSFRYTDEQVKAQDELLGVQKETTKVRKKLSEEDKKSLIRMASMTEAGMKQHDVTDEQIASLQELREQAEKLGMPFDEFIQNMDEIDGRWLMIEGFKNLGEAIMSVFKTLGEAWETIFPSKSVEERAKSIFDLLAAFHRVTQQLSDALNFDANTETIDNLRRTFEGLFAVLDIVKTLVGGALKVAFGALKEIFKHFNGDILGVTAKIGDWLVALRDSIKEADIFAGAVDKITSFISAAVEAFAKFRDAVYAKLTAPSMGVFASLLDRIKERLSMVGDAARGIKDGFVRAFDAICTNLENSSFFELMQMLWNGVKTIGSGVANALGSIIGVLTDKLGNADFKGFLDIINTMIAGGIGLSIKKFFDGFNEGFDGVGGVLEKVTGILDDVRGCFEAYQTQLKAGTLMQIAQAIAVLVASLVVISLIDSAKLSEAIGAITMLFTDLIGAMAIIDKTSIGEKGLIKIAGAMIGMSIGILIMAAALKTLGDLDFAQILTGATGIVALTATMVQATKSLSTDGTAIMKGATQLILMAVAIKILASACIDMSAIPFTQLINGLGGVVILMGMTSLFVNNTNMSGKMMSTAVGMVVFATAIKILASACIDMSAIPFEQLINGLGGVVGLMGATSLFINSTNATDLISTGVGFIAIAAGVKVLASCVADMATLSWEEIAKGMLVVGGALVGMGLALKLMPSNMMSMGAGLLIASTAMVILSQAIRSLGGMTSDQMLISITTFGGALVLLAGALQAMTGCLQGAAALAVACAALTLLIPVMTMLGGMEWGEIVKGLVAIAGVFAIVGVAAYLLTPAAASIAALAGSFALISLSIIGIGAGLYLIAGAFTALAVAGTAGATAIVSAITVIITGLLGLIPAIVKLMGEWIVAFCGVIASCAPAIGEAIKALVLSTIDVLVECVPPLVDGFLLLLAELLTSLATYTPQIVDGLFQFILSLLDGLAEYIPELIVSAMNVIGAFFQGVVDALNGLDTESLFQGIIGVGLMSGLMLALSAVASLVPGAMIGVLGMGAVIAELALVLAAIGALAQIPGLEWLISEGGDFLQTLGTALGQFVGGIVAGVAEGATSTLPQVGKNLADFMTNVQPFIDGVSSINENTMSGVTSLVDAILALTGAGLLDTIASWLGGGNSLGDFAEQLVPFGEAMKSYSDKVAGINIEAVNTSVAAAKGLADVADAVPGDGLFGTDGIDDFGKNIVDFGSSMKDYADKVSGINVAAVTASVTVAKDLIDIAGLIPDDGIFGTDGIDNFGDNITHFANSLKNYGDKAADISISAINNSVAATNKIISMVNNMVGLNSSGVSTFADAIDELSHVNVRSFVSAFEGLSPDLVAVGSNLVEMISKGMQSKSSALNLVASDIMNSAFVAIKTTGAMFQAAGIETLSKFISGVSSQTDRAQRVFSTMLTGLATTIRGCQPSFYNAGAYLVTGFAAGISANSYKAAAKARAMAAAAANAARKELDIHSPSRVAYEIGDYFGIGFVDAITGYAKTAYNASADMATSAKDGLGTAIGKISDLISNDIDAQPTIRPVMDLSNVRTGVDAIGSMLDGSNSVGVMANIGAINSMMSRRGQNGVNDDVVSAIDKLRKDIAKMPNNSYQINGVTYDDGSNIATAMQQIVRAAQVERRV